MSQQLTLAAWADFAGASEPASPSRVRARARLSHRAAPRASASKPSSSASSTESPSSGRDLGSTIRGLRWTLSDWQEHGIGYVRWWLPDGHDAEPRIAAAVDVHDRKDAWSIMVRRPVGQGLDATVWWSGGSFVERVELVSESGVRTTQAREVPVPHARTLEEGQRRADRSLVKLARRFGRAA